jgi:L-malate glycosyltransferase
VERCIAHFGLQDKVIFLGKQESVIELLSIADLFLLPSEKESFGLVALEAMACQVPVIASDVGGIPEVVKDGLVGYLAPVGDVHTMAAKAINILSQEDLRQEMSLQARNYALEHFHIDTIIPQYEDYYQKIMNQVR